LGREADLTRGTGTAPRFPVEAAMNNFVRDSNIQHYRKMIAESELDPSRDERRHRMLLTLLAEEMAKGLKEKDLKGPLDS
jgi:hypothetical protein